MSSINEITFYLYLAYTVIKKKKNFEEADGQNEPQKTSWRLKEILCEY